MDIYYSMFFTLPLLFLVLVQHQKARLKLKINNLNFQVSLQEKKLKQKEEEIQNLLKSEPAANEPSLRMHPLDTGKQLNSEQTQFIEKLNSYLNENFHNPKVNAHALCNALAISESQLQRKTKRLLNQSIPEYIRCYRLYKAVEILHPEKPITEVAFSVGFSSSTYFSQCFKNQFGMTPKAMKNYKFNT